MNTLLYIFSYILRKGIEKEKSIPKFQSVFFTKRVKLYICSDFIF